MPIGILWVNPLPLKGIIVPYPVYNSKARKSFKIKSYGEIQDNDEVNIVPFECVDNKFSKCTIFIITKKKENNRMQFYINYNEVKFVYNIYND